MTKAHKSVLDGVVETVVPGSSLDVNDTDPKNPIINARIANQATAEAGTDNTQLMTALTVAQSIAKNSPPTLPPRYWEGYQHSNNITTPNTKIDISSGSSRDSTNAINIVNEGGTIDLTTVGINGLDVGSLTAGTWHYTFAITTAAGVTAFLASLSPTAPTLPSGYTKFRRVGSFLVDMSSAIIPFVHVNDTWYWQTARRDINTNTVDTTYTVSASISVPRLLGVVALGAFTFFAGSGAINAVLMPTFVPNSAANGHIHNVGATGGSIPTRVMVDALARVKYRSSAASSTFVFDTSGWIDQL